MRKIDDDCRYCSVVSKANREDPIGTAGTVDEWLLVEVPQPWKTNLWEAKPEFQPLLKVVERLASQPIRYFKTRLLAIAPDKTYTNPELVRVFHYKRPAKLFAQYTKWEYLLPLTQLAPLTEALLFQPQQLINFVSYQQPTEHIREILICTHANYDRACGRFGYPLYQQLRKQYATENLRLWQTNHFGGHQFAPTLIDFPYGQVWGHLEVDILDCLIYRLGDVEQLRPYYRGWTGLSKFEQIAEREIWMQMGWEWLNYEKTGRILAQDEGGSQKKLLKIIFKRLPCPKLKLLVERWNEQATWVKLAINYTHKEGDNWGTYTALVKQTGTVTTKLKSGDDVPLARVNQYGVEELGK
ncbi:sucrase ferredoxin [Nostoc parmelioides]|uniref:Sucrase ferredoxin n=1 Tax=Nostoc parmelioides FACHB-3921 TaxID=2692909 RepID=A0ABR8BIL2_9NOSO|nr:sucrase ferredoxin [Nostoc parmelioides]MBD2252788.1 sucrase ferredoxin [Nostoc parmelioides FACHB-3921]